MFCALSPVRARAFAMMRACTLASVRKRTLALSLLLAGCHTVKAPPPAAPVVPAPVATHSFAIEAERDDVVGELQVTSAGAEDTLSDIARRFNIGYDEITRANPGVDPWLPRAGTQIVLPTQFVLPNAPRKGVVINLPALRLYYFPPRKPGEPQQVITHPIGIGLVGWSTPEGSTQVVGKKADPWWIPPASVRREHLRDGDPLPARVPPGPDNPLGRHALRLGWPSYLIHGTNKPYGVGMRASHGCIRMYPEDIARLFEDIPVGTPVTVVNQPLVYGWHGGHLYVQSFPVLEDDSRKHAGREKELIKTALKADGGRGAAGAGKGKGKGKGGKAGAEAGREVAAGDGAPDRPQTVVDHTLLSELTRHPRGLTVPVSRHNLTLEQYLAGARRVQNQLPAEATWNGVD